MSQYETLFGFVFEVLYFMLMKTQLRTRHFNMKTMVVFLLLFVVSLSSIAKDPTAYEMFYQMYDQSIHLNAQPMYVKGNKETPITYGAEKEGYSDKILRVMSPTVDTFETFLNYHRDKEYINKFIKEFINGRHHNEQPVVDANGNEIKIKIPSNMKTSQWLRKLNGGLDRYEAIDEFVKIFPRSPFSFISEKKIYELFHNERTDLELKRTYAFNLLNFEGWEARLGTPEKYIMGGANEEGGIWEILFKPQATYADFEVMQNWFRQTMGDDMILFDSPGHQRVVMPLISFKTIEEETEFKEKAAEVSRMLQTLLVLRGIKGKTGLLGARYKDINTDGILKLLNTGKGPLKIESDRFYKNSIGVEFRVGMKDEHVRHYTQAIFASRLATNDMQDIFPITKYSLIPDEFNIYYSSKNTLLQKFTKRYHVPEEILEQAINNFKSVSKSDNHSFLEIHYMLPLWNWENVPFLKGKKQEIIRISRDYIYKMAQLTEPTYEKVHELLENWVTASDLIRDIENYLTPKKRAANIRNLNMVEIKKNGIDVNQIDLGNEFTARMPLRLKGNYTDDHKWISTIYDMTPESRKSKILSLTKTLCKNLQGDLSSITQMSNGSHGHNLVIAFVFKDGKNRTWRVEWDGVNRNYNNEGMIIEGSARGGHIEIVSPKYNPTMSEIQAVYSAMTKESVIPDYRMGGSHINIDYELFEKNPKALARFLSLFHNHRGIISFMFQHINRIRAAEPVSISTELDKKLRSFDGNKSDLAQLLYEGMYFNPRKNRKTRYTQIDVSNFMKEAIPAEYIKPDFDVVKAQAMGGEGWTQQFRITEAKKLEMRLFDAPRDSYEAALQIKLVRALLNIAFNSDAEIFGRAQSVDHAFYTENIQQAYKDLKSMADQLGLDFNDYRNYVTNKYSLTKYILKNPEFRSWDSIANEYYPKVENWKKTKTIQSLSVKASNNQCSKVFSGTTILKRAN